MASQLSGIAIILFIAFGSLTFILLFIFAKRQITRFALKSRHGPHFPVAVDAPKHLRLEIERRLDIIDKIQCEPWLLDKTTKALFDDDDNVVSQLSPLHLYRMKVVDDVKELSNLICSKNSSLSKRFHENTVQYYLRLHKDGAITNVDAQCLYKFLVMYENARHQPYDFGYTEYAQFVPLLKIIKNAILKTSSNQSDNKSKTKSRDDEVLMDESATPLLNRCTKSSLSIRKFAHETTV